MRQLHRLAKSGYTLAEVLIVVAIIGILAAVSLPRLGRVRDQSQMSAAMSRFTRAVFAARQAAIQRGKRSYFKHDNNYVWVTVDTTGNNTDSVIVTSALSLLDLFGVTVTAPSGLTAIEYDPRGVSSQATAKVFKFSHRGGRIDSLCVSKLGNTIRTACP